MPISQLGQLNTTALQVADVYVQIVPPQFLLNGVPSSIVGLVGSAAWGPKNQPMIVGSPGQYSARFGAIQARAFDMGTYATIMFQQGATALKCVRVTDGTDAAATIVVQTTCITFTSKYTGSLANGCQVSISPGSKTGTFQVRVAQPYSPPEIFDNIGLGLTANALWVEIARVINEGQSGFRSASELIVATAGIGTTAPATATVTLSGGTDGATGVDKDDLLGVDTVPRTGMYTLRGQDCSIGALCDLTDHTAWATVDAFGLQEGIFFGVSGAAGQSIATAKSNKVTAGTDSYGMKVLLGDFAYWQDTTNGVLRMVSPVPFWAGLVANLAPNQSSLNKRVLAIAGTQKSLTGIPYTQADLQELALSGIDTIANPVPGGNYFGFRNGRNASSNPVIRGENYTRMTNYIAATINRGIGIYIGQLQSADTRRRAKTTLDAFFAGLQQQGLIGTADGLSDAFQTILDNSNNPQPRVALGYMQADVKVIYLSIIEFFLVNIEGGQSVTISRRPNQLI